MDDQARPAGSARHPTRRARHTAALVLLVALAVFAVPMTPTGLANVDVGAAEPAERFRTGFPDAFVSTATGQPVAMVGVNLRHAVAPNGWHLGRDELRHIVDEGFNMVRLSLTWRDFEPDHGVYNELAFSGLETLLDDLDSLGLHVILDPIHTKGAGERGGNWHEIPAWVWAMAPAVTTYSEAQDEMLDRLDRYAGGYLAEMTRRVADRSAVVAIDLVNEPRSWPPIDRIGPNDGQDRMLDVYDGLISTVRAIDPDQILVLEPIYGNSDPRQADLGRISATNRTNLIWSVHDYYSGDAGVGYTVTGRVTGTQLWSGLDYPLDQHTRSTLIAGQRELLNAHVDWAARWSLPVFIGEYGAAVDAPHGTEFLQDKTALYDEAWAGTSVGLPRAFWVWTYDDRFGLHSTESHDTHPYTDILTAGRAAPPTATVPPTTVPPTTVPPTTVPTTTVPPTTVPPTTVPTTTASPPPRCGAGGYVLGEADGQLHPFGLGITAAPEATTSAALVDLAVTPDQCGVWALHSDGLVTSRGDAGAIIAAAAAVSLQPGERFVALTPTPAGAGLWLFTSHGRVVTLGDAILHAGAGGATDLLDFDLQGPIIDSTATPDGNGYLMLGTDGGVFAFGSARYQGSLPGLGVDLAARAVGLVATDEGYWIVSADGGLFAFGAPFLGSVPQVLGPGTSLNQPVVGMVSYGSGYLQVASDGGIFVFADEPFLGSLGAAPPDTPVVAVG